MAPTPTYISNIPSRLEKTLFLLGGYTDKSVLAHAPAGGEGEGLYSVLFDPEEGSLKKLSTSSIKTNPAFIMKHPTLDIVYMTTEVISDGGSEILVGELDRYKLILGPWRIFCLHIIFHFCYCGVDYL